MGGAKGLGSKPPSVFISWAHRDSKMTKSQAATWWQQVRALGERLNSVGCDVRLDMFTPDADWSRWGPEMIDESDFTLLVPNRVYRQRWDGRNSPREGAGAAREINTLKGRFDKNQEEFRTRTIIIMLPGITEDDVPDEIYAYLKRFPINPITGEGMEALLRFLTKQPEFVLPPLGEVPYLPPQPPIFLGTSTVEVSQSTEAQPSGIEEAPSAGNGKISALPFAQPQHTEISRIIERVENTGAPPDRPPVEDDLYEWFTRLADWVDEASSLPGDIERIGQLVSKSPSARFLQTLDETHSSIQSMLDNLDSQPTMPDADILVDAADQLWDLIILLVRQSMEP
jgi:hypothetical protein